MRCKLLTPLLVVAAACGQPISSEFSGSGSGGDVDNRYHPPASGEQVSEAEACGVLRDAFKAELDARKCVATLQQCPAFLRSHYAPACMNYDLGTVQGCIAYFAGAKSCDELVMEDCVLVGYPDTADDTCT